jgi:hypothetical protein
MVRAMVRLLALVLLVPSLCCLAVAAEKKPAEAPGDFPKPKDGKPWEHKEFGIRLPQQLGTMAMTGGYRYEASDLGVSIRYENADGRVRADIYVYPCKAPHATDEEELKVASTEAGNALGEVKEMENRGRYKKVEFGEGESWGVQYSASQETAFVEVPISYEINEDEGTGTTTTAVRSRLGIAVVGDHFVKVRYTYPADRKDEGMAESVEWLKKVRLTLSEPFLRSLAVEGLKAYHDDPFSVEGAQGAGAVVSYAEDSPFVSLHIPGEIPKWGEACSKQDPDSTLHLLRAFIAGGVEASLQEKSGDEVIEHAIAEVSQIYAKMKKQHSDLKCDELEKLTQAVSEKKALEFFKKLDSISGKAK